MRILKKKKLLCILHRSPPFHGAAKIGDFISESSKLQETFDCKFVTIKSSDAISDIGKINFKKIYFVFQLYFRILFTLLIFRPNIIYFTASVRGVAFYRDLLLSTLWKIYSVFKNVNIYYHYHTKGIESFVSLSKLKLYLTNFFLKNINIILLSHILKKDFKSITTYKNIFILPNGVEDIFSREEFGLYLKRKFSSPFSMGINILYLSNMIKSKGYFEVLKLVKAIKEDNIHCHFAGSWQNDNEENEFFEYIRNNDLEKNVTFHGFIDGRKKNELFKKSHLFIFPTRYKNEASPLVLLEALSYGIPIISTNEGSIPNILDKYCGIILQDIDKLYNAYKMAYKNYINIQTAQYCRKKYLNNFSMKKFEENLIRILE